jgi:hypothetical protein
MNAADPSSCEHAQPDSSTGRECAANSGRSGYAGHEAAREVACANLSGVGLLGEGLQLVTVEAHAYPAIEDAYGRGHGTSIAHCLLGFNRDQRAATTGKPVRYKSGFEGNGGRIGGKSR